MSDSSFVLLIAVFALVGSLLGFLFPDGGFLPVRTFPVATREQSVKFTTWAMLVVSVIAFVVWLSIR